MDLKLKDKVAIVTGAGSQIGYGRAIALTLADEGCNLILGDIDLEAVIKTADEIRAFGKKVIAVKVDVRDSAQVNEMVNKGIEEFGHIDILVNNAGASSRMMPFIQSTRKDWEYDIGVNLIGQMTVAHAVLPHMISRKSGRIINTSGGQGIPTLSMYGAAKAGIVMFTRSLAKELQGTGVIATVYSPGLGATGLTKDDPRMDRIAPTLPLGRLCTPQDVAPIVAFLASELSNYMAASMAGI
ncbi:MAG: SDR family oxidoreductase [Deltaproteobacteria bacterium]|nr:SDR family oxidoreductase [Deltaproteobacteria bacterium]